VVPADPSSSVFVKLRSCAKRRWTREINVLHFAKLTCESGARKCRSSDTPASRRKIST
jgi:hypothetical protein